MKCDKINQIIKLLIIDQVINKILNIIIAISYALCNTVDACLACQPADANVVQKSVSFCKIMSLNV